MLNFAKAALVFLKRDDRREWLALLAVSLAGGVSRSMFLATVNSAVLAIEQRRASAFYFFVPALLMVIALGAQMFVAIRGKMVVERLGNRIRSNLAREIGQTNLRFIEQQKIHELHYHLMGTIDALTESYLVILVFAGAAITLAFNTVYIAWLSPIGLLIVLIVAVVGVTADWLIEQTNTQSRRNLDDLRRRSHGVHREFLDGFKELRLSDAKADDMHRLIDEINREQYEASVHVARVTATGTAATDLFLYSAIGIFGVGFSLLASIPPVEIMQLITVVLFTMAPLTTMVGSFPNFGRARVALRNLQRLSGDIEQAREPAPLSASAQLPQFKSVSLKDIVFRFGEAPGAANEDFVLGPINLTIERGDVVCIVGGNGSGKTVMMRLITGLYPPTSGELLFNGQAVARENMKAYRDHFTTVFNDFFLFRDLLGHRDAGPDAVTKWLNYFGISGKTRFADGAFTTVELSTGQRKRLALIVALLDERPILMLDEFGAEQDPEHRDQFYRLWLPELRKMGMTIVIVSHDDAYFECADMLVRMDYGKIVECRRTEQLPLAERAPLQSGSRRAL